MQESKHLTILVISYGLIAVLIAWSLWKKEKWLKSAILALSFSSGSLIFLFVREQLVQYGTFHIGFSVGMYASAFATIPLAAFGWFLGKKLNMRLTLLAAIIGIVLNFLVTQAYQYMIKISADVSKKEIVLDCRKLPYHCAIRDNRLEDISTIKKNGMNIEIRDSLSRSALWYGINNEEAVKLLLENGANPDGFNINSETPLTFVMVLSLKPNLKIAKLLIDHGAQINRTIGFRKKISILNFAIINNNIDVINFALENGADPNFVDGYRKSPCDRLKKMPAGQIKNLNKYCF